MPSYKIVNIRSERQRQANPMILLNSVDAYVTYESVTADE